MQPTDSKWTVGFWGARDRYEVAAAMAETGQLERLVSDFYCPELIGRAILAMPHISADSFVAKAAGRNHELIPFAAFDTAVGMRWLRKCAPRDPVSRSELIGYRSAEVANRSRSGLLIYSYEVEIAARTLGRDLPLVVFQVHPTPSHVRRVMKRLRLAEPALPFEPEERLTEIVVHRHLAALQRASAVICSSSFVRSGLIDDGVDPARIALVPYGVSSEVPQTMHAHRPEGEALKVGWLGQPTTRKGFDVFIGALHALRRRDVEVRIIGRCPGSISELFPRWSRVTFSGPVSEEAKFAELVELDVFVAPSRLEGYGLSIHEALAVGVPVIGTANSMVADLRTAPETHGVISVQVGSPAALAEALESLGTDFTRDVLTRGAIRRVVARRTWPAFREGVRACVNSMP
jgi:glycosyltransferase involved in cell wall biosynthesis